MWAYQKKKKKTSAVQEMQLSVHKLGFFFYNYILQENMSTDQTLILVKKKKNVNVDLCTFTDPINIHTRKIDQTHSNISDCMKFVIIITGADVE